MQYNEYICVLLMHNSRHAKKKSPNITTPAGIIYLSN
jgi:hypothetical protein